MPMFHYEAADRTGRTVVGSMDARDEATVRSRLAQRGYTPLLVEASRSGGARRSAGPASGTAGGRHMGPSGNGDAPPGGPATGAPVVGPTGYGSAPGSGAPYGSGYGSGAGSGYSSPSAGVSAGPDVPVAGRRVTVTVPNKALAQFYRQAANTVKSGIPMTQALPLIASQTSDRRLRDAVRLIEEGVSRGRPISEGMAKSPRAFSAGHVGLVRAGEGGGYLERALNELANQAEADWNIETSTRFNFLLFISKWFVLPWLGGYVWFMARWNLWHTAEGGFSMSGFTRAAVESLVASAVTMLVVNVAVPLLWTAMRGTAVAAALESVAVGMPVLGARRKRVDRAKTLGALSSAMSAGIPLTVSWLLAADAADTEKFRKRLLEQYQAVRAGTPIPVVLSATGLYDENTLQLAHSGEMSGNLPDMLDQAVHFQREEARQIGNLIPWVYGVLIVGVMMVLMAYLVIVFGAQVYGGNIERALDLSNP